MPGAMDHHRKAADVEAHRFIGHPTTPLDTMPPLGSPSMKGEPKGEGGS